MTVRQFYEYCKSKRLLDYPLQIDYYGHDTELEEKDIEYSRSKGKEYIVLIIHE